MKRVPIEIKLNYIVYSDSDSYYRIVRDKKLFHILLSSSEQNIVFSNVDYLRSNHWLIEPREYFSINNLFIWKETRVEKYSFADERAGNILVF